MVVGVCLDPMRIGFVLVKFSEGAALTLLQVNVVFGQKEKNLIYCVNWYLEKDVFRYL